MSKKGGIHNTVAKGYGEICIHKGLYTYIYIHNTVGKGYGEICIHKGLYAYIYIYAHCSLYSYII